MVTARRHPKPAEAGVLIPSVSTAGPVSTLASSLRKGGPSQPDGITAAQGRGPVTAPLTPSGRPRSAAIEICRRTARGAGRGRQGCRIPDDARAGTECLRPLTGSARRRAGRASAGLRKHHRRRPRGRPTCGEPPRALVRTTGDCSEEIGVPPTPFASVPPRLEAFHPMLSVHGRLGAWRLTVPQDAEGSAPSRRPRLAQHASGPAIDRGGGGQRYSVRYR
jgi:hypothetical protein